jgi:hypothetical protein
MVNAELKLGGVRAIAKFMRRTAKFMQVFLAAIEGPAGR